MTSPVSGVRFSTRSLRHLQFQPNPGRHSRRCRQGLYVVPTLGLVVIVHAGRYDRPLKGSLSIAILNLVLASIEPRL